MNMQDFRQKIDEIDRSLVELIEKRMDLSVEIGIYKKENNIAIYDPKREEEKLTELCALVKKGKESYIKEIYTLIFDLSRLAQEKIING